MLIFEAGVGEHVLGASLNTRLDAQKWDLIIDTRSRLNTGDRCKNVFSAPYLINVIPYSKNVIYEYLKLNYLTLRSPGLLP